MQLIDETGLISILGMIQPKTEHGHIHIISCQSCLIFYILLTRDISPNSKKDNGYTRISGLNLKTKDKKVYCIVGSMVNSGTHDHSISTDVVISRVSMSLWSDSWCALRPVFLDICNGILLQG